MSQYYHVATYIMDYTLCGLFKTNSSISWDPPITWNERETSGYYSGNRPKCLECMAHPDWPLLLLGEL